MIEIRWVVACKSGVTQKSRKEGWPRGMWKLLGLMVHYLHCGEYFTGIYIYQNLINHIILKNHTVDCMSVTLIKAIKNVVHKHSYFFEKVLMSEKVYHIWCSFPKGPARWPKTHLWSVLGINDWYGRMHSFFLDSSCSLIRTKLTLGAK